MLHKTIAAMAVLTLMASATLADDNGGKVKPAEIGDIAPGWKDLPGTDGNGHSLSDLDDKAVVVVCFTCNTCPYSVDYEDRMIALQKGFTTGEAKAALVAINSNLVPADSMEKMRDRSQAKKFNFPYLKDTTQSIAAQFGAIYTPEFFVLNQERRIIYKGALDDSTKAENVKINYVSKAVDAALDNKLPEISYVGARGCAIRFKRSRR